MILNTPECQIAVIEDRAVTNDRQPVGFRPNAWLVHVVRVRVTLSDGTTFVERHDTYWDEGTAKRHTITTIEPQQ